MTLTAGDLWALLRESVLRPRGVVRRLLDAPLGAGILWQALVVMAILAGLLAWSELFIGPEDSLPFARASLPGPAAMSLMQFGLLAILVPAIHFGGRIFGGKGEMLGALKVVAWWQGLTLVLQVAELIAILALPFLGVLVIVATFVALVWTLTNAVAELHGFRSLGLVLVGIIATGVVVMLILSFLLTAFGVVPPGSY
ncbi:YIP1 family protein [Acidimangrovimonas sediminis]|uniref:YIP1 family protein n=1 Tax=Acidimangrovimonas sediminis TaxID=2056283 RepID=UPI000C802E46|nr:YIP1 family protein [Acidimangrovimonas sediminis]